VVNIFAAMDEALVRRIVWALERDDAEWGADSFAAFCDRLRDRHGCDAVNAAFDVACNRYDALHATGPSR
jgi:hypothetical protein